MTEPTQPGQPGETSPARSAGSEPRIPGGASGPRAGFGSRLVAFIVDLIVIVIVIVIAALIGGAIAGENGAVVGYLLAIVISAVYYIYFEGGATGQTPGKKVANIRVVDYATGGPIGYGRGIGRYFARWLSQIPCYLGYFWMLWDGEKQTWHDKVSNAYVVPADAVLASPAGGTDAGVAGTTFDR